MSAAESNSTDVQQRILLEVAYEAVENGRLMGSYYHHQLKITNTEASAGIPKEELAGSDASVYIGSFVKGTCPLQGRHTA